MEEIIQAAHQYALDEIEKYRAPHPIIFEISEQKALELAPKFDIDKDVLMIGYYLMDIKLGQAKAEKRLKDHVDMSVEAAKDFLSKYEINQEKKDKIINCVAAHHNDVKYSCLEAEVCANADCYKFLTPKGALSLLFHLGIEGKTYDQALKFTESKIDEKYNILSLDICKAELEQNYKYLKSIFSSAQKE